MRAMMQFLDVDHLLHEMHLLRSLSDIQSLESLEYLVPSLHSVGEKKEKRVRRSLFLKVENLLTGHLSRRASTQTTLSACDDALNVIVLSLHERVKPKRGVVTKSTE